jgi:hypothetical protein
LVSEAKGRAFESRRARHAVSGEPDDPHHITIALSGCVFADAYRFDDSRARGCNARVFHLLPPASEYEEIGFIRVEGGVFTSVNDVRDEMQDQACALGADAVYVNEPQYSSCSLNTFQYLSINAVALRSTKRAAAPVEAPVSPVVPDAPPAPLGG